MKKNFSLIRLETAEALILTFKNISIGQKGPASEKKNSNKQH